MTAGSGFTGPSSPARPSRVKATLVFVGSWIVGGLAFSLLFFALTFSDEADYAALDEHGIHTTATVTRTEPQKHNTVYYTFEVAGTSYSDADLAHNPNPDAADLRVGDTIQIVYDARVPSRSCACDPHDSKMPVVTRVSVGLFGFWIPAIGITIWWWRRQRQETPQHPSNRRRTNRWQPVQ